MTEASADILIVGAGLAGLVAAIEGADAGRSVLLLDQENEANLGGQAFWSFGGLFFIDSPEQRRTGIHDSFDLASRDWENTAGFDREEDKWPREWARAYLTFAHEEKRRWLHSMGVRWFPAVGWAERGTGANGPGNSVPRFHVTWGTGPALIEPFVRKVLDYEKAGRITLRFRHQVKEVLMEGGVASGVEGDVLEPSFLPRGEKSSRRAIGGFRMRAQVVIVASGGIGGNFGLVREHWPKARLGAPPEFLLSGVPAYVDGLMQQAAVRAGARHINADRMWHYTEGVRNWSPIWPNHGIRILPGPSSLWLSPAGERLPFPHIPGADTLGTLQHIRTRGYPFTWFLLNRQIIRKEFALSGSEQNPDLTSRSLRLTLGRLRSSVQPPVQAFMDRGEDFVVSDDLAGLVEGMNRLEPAHDLDYRRVTEEVQARDAQLANRSGKDPQLAVVRNARRLFTERLVRVAPPSPILDRSNGPLIAVRLSILTRKSLGGLETDLSARVIGKSGEPIPGLLAAGEVAGFGGGGMHGYRALEGTFLGGCLFSGKTAGRAAAHAVI